MVFLALAVFPITRAQVVEKNPSVRPAPAPAGQVPEDGELISEPIPLEAVRAAVTAVEKLGEEVVLGKYQVAIDRMNPMWKERAAARAGGMEKLDAQLANASAAMVRQGITIISFRPQGEPRAFEVWPGMRVVKTASGGQTRQIYTKWMVLVPTVTRFRITPQGSPKPLVIESTAFQVAICDKGKNDWTFIDGANLKPTDLRDLFVTLPQDLELPPVGKKQVL